MKVAEKIAAQSVAPDSVVVWWLGQNSYLLRTAGADIMIDPYFSRPGPPEKYLHAEAPIAADEFGPGFVFCTHDHSDHTDPGYLLPLSQRWPHTRFYGPPESARRMLDIGIPPDRVEALAPGDLVELGPASLQVVLSKTPEVSDVSHFGYIADLGGIKVYDTGDIMRGVTRQPALLEPIRKAAPHIALITTSPTEEEFPDFDEAAALARAIGAHVASPAHYGCFANRTFDPQPFAAAFTDPAGPRAVIIPYCDSYTLRLAHDGSALDF